tara:strand:+ start:24561 stop:25181 length:621 start_codon:yes stop_codon:yes gene_type:complete
MPEIADTTPGGTGLLAIFCDLDVPDRADFRPWLQEDMFPARMAIGFNACASYDLIAGEGQQFLTLYEMPSLGHLYGEAYQGLRRTRGPRDAAYHQKFRNPDRYTLTWAGPELGTLTGGADGLAPFLQIDRFDLGERDIQAFNIWFAAEYLPMIARERVDVRIRRYLSMEGRHSHVVLHESESPIDRALGDLPTQRLTGRYQRAIAS